MIRVANDADELFAWAAEEFVTSVQGSVALSGGSTPKRLYELLATPHYRSQLDWPRVNVFWSDERYVPLVDSRSNERMARDALLTKVRPNAIFGMFGAGGPAAAAARYEKLLPIRLNLVLLGLGKDCHTASLFPGDASVTERTRRVVASKGPPPIVDRITLTPPAILSAAKVIFLVAGEEKAEAVARTIQGDVDELKYPAQAIARRRDVLWLLDAGAAKLL